MAQIRVPTINAVTDVIESTDLPLGIASATVALTDAQIKALPTTPITIVAAPGANKAILLIGMVASLLTVSAADYTNINAAAFMPVGLNSAQSIVETGLNEVTGFLAPNSNLGAARSYAMWGPSYAVDGTNVAGYSGDTESAIENTALVIRVNNGGSGALTGGNAGNSMSVTALYCVVDVL